MYSYIFTITFKGAYIYKQKWKKCIKLYEYLNRYLDVDGELAYSIEYHKRKLDGKDNFTAPHLHGVLTTMKRIVPGKLEFLTDQLKKDYGRTQFFIQEDKEELQGWKDYVMKDVVKNEEHTGLQHYFVCHMVAKKNKKDIEDIFESDDEL